MELALVLPLLVMLAFGAIEYGWMFFRMHEVHSVAQSAVREAVLPDATNGTVIARASGLMTSYRMAGTGFTTVIKDSAGTAITDITTLDPGTIICVSVQVPYNNVNLISLPFLPSPTNLSATVSMAKEGPS